MLASTTKSCWKPADASIAPNIICFQAMARGAFCRAVLQARCFWKVAGARSALPTPGLMALVIIADLKPAPSTSFSNSMEHVPIVEPIRKPPKTADLVLRLHISVDQRSEPSKAGHAKTALLMKEPKTMDRPAVQTSAPAGRSC